MRFSGIGVLVVGLGVLWVSAVQAQQVGFTQADRERMVRIETTLQMFMESTNQRFEQVNQRFAEQREDINQRFEQVDQRFAEQLSFLQIITGIFTVIMVAAIGFAFWDRRTTISKAKEVTLEALEKQADGKENALVERVVAEVLRRLEARKDTPPQVPPSPVTA